MSKKVTMQQIADQLGVSKFVVSKALSGKGGVRDETRERVIQAASQLGYFAQNNAYNKAVKAEAAAPLKPPASGKQSVVVLMPNIRFQTKESQYWGRILDGIGARLEADGFGMIIVSEQSVEHFTHFLNPNGILGLIGVGEVSTPLLLEVHRIGLPIVLVDHEDMLIPTDTVFANNYESMHRLTKHLIASGHRRLAFVGDVAYSRSFKDRFFGFRSAAEDTWGVGCADEWLLTVAGYEPEQFEEPIRQWAARRVKAGSLPTALVCANDSIAIGAIAAMQSLGIAVPEGRRPACCLRSPRSTCRRNGLAPEQLNGYWTESPAGMGQWRSCCCPASCCIAPPAPPRQTAVSISRAGQDRTGQDSRAD
jgi:LacI family transcriptional regulator